MNRFNLGDEVWVFEYLGYDSGTNGLSLEELYLSNGKIIEIKINGYCVIKEDEEDYPLIITDTENLYLTRADAIEALIDRLYGK